MDTTECVITGSIFAQGKTIVTFVSTGLRSAIEHPANQLSDTPKDV